MSKIGDFLRNMHFGHVLIGIVSLIIIESLFVFFFGWKAPISLENEKDKAAIELMLSREHPNNEFSNITIKTVVFSNLVDTLETLYPHLKNELSYKTQTVFYDRTENDSITVSCATIFEIDGKFLKDRVGQPLFHLENIYRHF